MLRRFAPAVRKGDPRALVIAGATAPTGNDDRWRTSPQTFARTLKAAGAGKLFDAYSHHPYTPGRLSATLRRRPCRNPDGTTVTLANLKTLLRIFPSKPFYLTEYGYNTKPSVVFGDFSVSARTQAKYLRRAYAVARRYRHVKMLMWFLVKDMHTRRPARLLGHLYGAAPAQRQQEAGLEGLRQTPLTVARLWSDVQTA